MFYKASSSVLAALLVVTLAWVHCSACLPAFAASSQPQDDHSCCPKPKSDDHCNRPSGKDKQDCPGMSAGAQDYTYKADTGVAAPVLAALPAPVVESLVPSIATAPVETTAFHSPPDLFLRNSALLI